MHKEDKDWMAYIDAEVKAACGHRGLVPQIRRKWSVREKPVAESPIEDYEWKLVKPDPGTFDAPDEFEGTYYVLGFDKVNGRFLLQHDNWQGGDVGPHWEVTTYTEIRWGFRGSSIVSSHEQAPLVLPPVGWLRDHLLRLIDRFEPNSFSVT